ncbi:Retrovirus-related Pol polyprotein from transposon 17.6 [Vitis vinifera]|uniref:Retrovirus-related Pol polyprotein from transposon 17.6 n=1 Tax=Vitis vinifera TaxID=29760 RepID=A0A438G4I6_VITVI|nr:Retrovirus-related Pol polyprotein from transposon 17.6 [Vitis vinifera]
MSLMSSEAYNSMPKSGKRHRGENHVSDAVRFMQTRKVMRADVSSPVEGTMAEVTHLQEVRREMLEMMKEFERKQELWENQLGHSTKVDFPKFNGGGLDGWLLRVEYFFEVDRTPPEARVHLAALHLEGKAIQWHQGYIKTRGNEAYLDWSEYDIALNARFGQHVFYDPIADLRNLRQTVFFLSGLIDELQMPVRKFKPQTLADAYSLARLQEIAVAALQNKPKPIQVETDGERPEGNLQMEGLGEEDEQIQLSLNALMSNEDSQTMTLNGNYKGRSLFVLIDSGSSHNFLSSKVAKRVDYCWKKARGIRVTVANGHELHCTALCSDFRWKMQGQEFIAEGKNKLQERMSPWADKLKGLVEQPGLFAIQDLSDATLWAIQLAENTHLEETLTPQQQEELQKMLQAFADVFEEPTGLPPVRDYDHQIDLKDEAGPINCRPYRYAAVQKDAIEKLIGEMLHAGVIRQSRSPYASPVVLVKKKDGSWRLCVDYRALNQVTVKDKFPIPVIEELLEELGGSTIFSKIDLRSGYWQIRMHEPDMPKTAFKTHEGHYEFLVMPFGLTNAPSTFQSLMNNIFQPYLRKFILVLRENLLYAKSNKCFFGHSSIEYLGHVISSRGVYTDPQKVAADYGKIAKPLTDLLKKDAFHWTEGSNQAFMALKQAMITAPVLALPNFSKEFIIETDASGQGIGAVLMQEGHPIAYISKALSDRVQTLSTYEKEMLAILMAIKKWESYLRVTTPTQQAWVAKLMQYDYEIRYKQGKENVAVDALSRIQPAELFVLSTTILNTQLYDLIKESWGVDPELQKIIRLRKQTPLLILNILGEERNFGERGNWPFWRVCDYKANICSSLLEGFEEVCPRICEKLLCMSALQTRKINLILAYCNHCLFQRESSQASQWTSSKASPNLMVKTAIFVVVDRLTKYGHFMLLPHPYTAKMVAQVFLDSVYKLHGLPHSITCDRDPIFTSVFWQEFFKLQGVSLQLSTAYHPQTDGQTEVVNRCIETYLRCMAGDNPGQWANWISLAEFWYNTSYHSSLKMSPFEALYGYAPPLQIPYFPKDSNVEAVDRVLNERESWLQLLKHHISKAQQRMKIQADKNRFDREFNIGDMVLLKLQAYKQVSMHSGGPKLQPRNYGPFKVIDRIGTVAYQLQLPPDAQIHNVFHVSLLKPAHASIQDCSSLPISNTSTTLLPQAILDRRLVKRHNVPAVQLLIHWVDKSPADASWEFADDLKRRFPAFFLEDKEVS